MRKELQDLLLRGNVLDLAVAARRRPQTAETDQTPVPTDEVQLLTEIRDELRSWRQGVERG